MLSSMRISLTMMKMPHFLLLFFFFGSLPNSIIGLNVQFRSGEPNDVFPILTKTVLTQPISLNSHAFRRPQDFLIAVNEETGTRIGWAQIRPIRDETIENTLRDPNRYDALPGSYSVDQEIDDQMWDEFEDDTSNVVPSGWASLPWTKEYRAMAQGIQDREERREQLVQQRKQQRDRKKRELSSSWELVSVFVCSEYRGLGIGSKLVRHSLRRHWDLPSRSMTTVYVVTTNSDWYLDLLGDFSTVEECNNIPPGLSANIFNNNEEVCCAMRRRGSE